MSFGYTIISMNNISKGLDKITPDNTVINYDLYKQTVVLSEAYQTILRKHNMIDAYDKLKNFTRNNSNITIEDFKEYINTLDINDKIKEELYNISLTNYVGIC